MNRKVAASTYVLRPRFDRRDLISEGRVQRESAERSREMILGQGRGQMQWNEVGGNNTRLIICLESYKQSSEFKYKVSLTGS
jgi:hypothetical protein